MAEAYTAYNLAFTRFALGSCQDVLALLDRSESIQGERTRISRLRQRAEKSCEGSSEAARARQGQEQQGRRLTHQRVTTWRKRAIASAPKTTMIGPQSTAPGRHFRRAFR